MAGAEPERAAFAQNGISPRHLVETFYQRIWDRGEEAAALQILSSEFCFRGSLGLEKRGPDEFLEYVRLVRGALADYACEIVELVCEPACAAARMRFRGRHVGALLACPPTGNFVCWDGAAFFRFESGRIAELWVLGDIEALRRQLAARDPSSIRLNAT